MLLFIMDSILIKYPKMRLVVDTVMTYLWEVCLSPLLGVICADGRAIVDTFRTCNVVK